MYLKVVSWVFVSGLMGVRFCVLLLKA